MKDPRSRGCPPCAPPWIRSRGDVREVGAEKGPCLQAAGENPVTQRHYALNGLITPEMEFVAIRENLGREQAFKAVYDRYPNEKSRPDEAGEILDALTVMPRPSELEAAEGFGPSSMVARDRLDHQHAPARRRGCRMLLISRLNSSGMKSPRPRPYSRQHQPPSEPWP